MSVAQRQRAQTPGEVQSSPLVTRRAGPIPGSGWATLTHVRYGFVCQHPRWRQDAAQGAARIVTQASGVLRAQAPSAEIRWFPVPPSSFSSARRLSWFGGGGRAGGRRSEGGWGPAEGRRGLGGRRGGPEPAHAGQSRRGDWARLSRSRLRAQTWAQEASAVLERSLCALPASVTPRGLGREGVLWADPS